MKKRNSYAKKQTLCLVRSLAPKSHRPQTSLPRNPILTPKQIPELKLIPKLVNKNLIKPIDTFFVQKSQKGQYFNQYLSNQQILNRYHILSHIGKGCFSIVQLAIQKITQKPYAIKIYQKIDNLDWFRLHNIRRQIQNLLKLKHQNIIQLLHVIKDKKKILLILENGGKHSLAGLLRKNKKFTENQAKNYFRQILNAIDHCHSNGICHRDLKPENILVDQKNSIKIIDFGFSSRTKKKLNNYCGTPPFMSPQIVKKVPYNGCNADIWALGIILYLMLFGIYPFRATNQQQLYRLIQKGNYQIKSEVSNAAKAILSKMLEVDENKRASAAQLLKQSWLR